MPAGSLIATGLAGKKLVERVAEDLYELAKMHCSVQVKKWRDANNVDLIWKHVCQLRLVKTIWQVETYRVPAE